MKLTIHDPLPAVTRTEGNDAGVERLLYSSQEVIAKSLNEPVMKRPEKVVNQEIAR